MATTQSSIQINPFYSEEDLKSKFPTAEETCEFFGLEIPPKNDYDDIMYISKFIDILNRQINFPKAIHQETLEVFMTNFATDVKDEQIVRKFLGKRFYLWILEVGKYHLSTLETYSQRMAYLVSMEEFFSDLDIDFIALMGKGTKYLDQCSNVLSFGKFDRVMEVALEGILQCSDEYLTAVFKTGGLERPEYFSGVLKNLYPQYDLTLGKKEIENFGRGTILPYILKLKGFQHGLEDLTLDSILGILGSEFLYGQN